MQNMRKNRVEDGSYGNQCDECSKGQALHEHLGSWTS